jgi:hypothetical protein
MIRTRNSSPKLFLQLLANYLYAERHVALRITASGDMKSLEKIEITNLNLAELHGNSTLWRMATKESFEGHPGLPSLDKVQADMRQRLRAMQAQPSIWDKSRYRFAQWLIDEYAAEVKARERAKVGEVPNVTEYTKTESGRRRRPCRLDPRRADETRHRRIRARESHHTTQYLLAEFFGNHKDATQKAFPPPLSDFKAPASFPRATKSAASTAWAAASTSAPSTPIRAGARTCRRYCLSARCHQRGELHVLRESRWTDDNQQSKELRGTPTQGLAIENAFNSAISEPALRPRDASAEKRTRLRAQIAADPTGARQQYYSAAISTYRWMRKRMLPALKQALPTEEKGYYRGIAAMTRTEGDDLAPAYRLEEPPSEPCLLRRRKEQRLGDGRVRLEGIAGSTIQGDAYHGRHRLYANPEAAEGALIYFGAAMLIPRAEHHRLPVQPGVDDPHAHAVAASEVVVPKYEKVRDRSIATNKAELEAYAEQRATSRSHTTRRRHFSLVLELDAADALEHPETHPVARVTGVADRIAAHRDVDVSARRFAAGRSARFCRRVDLGSAGGVSFGASAGGALAAVERKEHPSSSFSGARAASCPCAS